MNMKSYNKLTSSLFIVPYLFMFIVFGLGPMIYGIWVSLHDWDLLSKKHTFIGLKNYLDIFNSETYLHDYFFIGLVNTLKFVVLSVPALVVFSLMLALLLKNLSQKQQNIFRTIYFAPYVLSVSVISVVWVWMLDTNSGFVNQILNKTFGLNFIPWLTEVPWAWFSIVLATLWWTIGFNMIIFINGLNQVPDDIYEASAIDGANKIQQFFYITLPSIKNVIMFTLLTSTIASFNIYGQPYMMTKGGPGNSTKTLLMYIVDEAFVNRNFGKSSAMSIILALIILTLVLVQRKCSKH